MSVKVHILLFSILCSTLIISELSYSQSDDTVYVYANEVRENTVVLDGVWRYHPGDDSLWASPLLNTADWDTVRTSMYFEHFPVSNWKGIGWFRKVIGIDSALFNKILDLRIHHYGASEIYINGKLKYSIGKISSDPDGIEFYHLCPNTVPLELDSNKYYTFAVRYLMPESIVEGFWYPAMLSHFGFVIRIDDLGHRIKTPEYSLMTWPLFTLSILFFLLFLFNRRQREYLYYSLFLLLLSIALIFIWLYWNEHNDFMYKYLYLQIHRGGVILAVLTLLACFYTIFYQRLLKPFWYFLAGSIPIMIFQAIYLNVAIYIYLGFSILMGIEATRIILAALRNKNRNAWVIGIGFIATFIAFTLQTLISDGILYLRDYFRLLTYLTVFSFPVSIMIYLVRSYSDLNVNLKKQLVTVKELSQKELEQKLRAQKAESENERKTKELEQARQLQLSMLPKEIPCPPDLDIAAYMKTATEVGGDYYDFFMDDDGTLTIVIGDATGHGLDAGMMVTATKSLFQSLVSTPKLTDIIRLLNKNLEALKLQPMYMTLRILRIKESHLEAAGAGMYPFLIYEKAANSIKEVESTGPPLGTFPKIDYTSHKFDLSMGDIILLMTDGFTERFNTSNQMIGDNRVKEILTETAGETADKIIDRFVREGDEWGGERPQDDDSTFVVIKVK